MKTKIISLISLNLVLSLTVFFNYSILSLLFLFTLLLTGLAVALHLLYLAVNNTRIELDSKKHFEEVSTQTITSLLESLHTVQVRTFDSCVHLVCFVDPVESVCFYILLHLLVAWIWVFNVSDMMFLWIASNMALAADFVWPLI
jgi:hypothetical protein